MKFQIDRLMLTALMTMYSCPVALASSSDTDATVVAGFNTAGTVRVCNLANLEALLNILAAGCEVSGILIGSFLLVKSLTRANEPLRKRNVRALTAALIVVSGILTPVAINWCVATARDANLFSCRPDHATAASASLGSKHRIA